MAEFKSIYKADKPLSRVKYPDGTYHDLEIGEPVPGAENWPNTGLWVKRGFISRIDGLPHDPAVHGPYVPPHSLTDDEAKEILDRKKRQLAGEDVSPPRWEKSSPSELEALARQPSVARDPSGAEMDATPKTEPASAQTLDELQQLTRGELFRLAKASNIKINGNDSKEALAKALSTR